MGENSNVILEAKGMKKFFGITKAVNDVSCEIRKGEVICLIGENGSGKSTLSNMFCGAYPPTDGQMMLHGKEYQPKNIIDARKHGIGIIVQEMGTINNLTVAENIFMGEEGRFAKAGFVNSRKMKQEATNILKELGVDYIKADQNVNELSFENRKLVELAMVMYAKPKILILDESTTALSQTGRDVVYKLIEKMKQVNNAVLFISHDMDEVVQISNKVIVMRDGIYIDTLYGDDINVNKMRSLMIGREMNENFYRGDFDDSYGETVMEIKNITAFEKFEDISFDLHKGEILGLGGLTDSGIHDICKAVFGVVKTDSGTVVYKEKEKTIQKSSDALECKMAYLSKNREIESMMVNASIKDNISISALDKLKSGALISKKKEKNLVNEVTKTLSVKMENMNQPCSALSGGNKQKVVICKWLANDSEILIMDCPTRGIDIGVKESIYQLMYKLKQEGKSIIMVSEELTELIGMSDSIYIIKDGRMSGKFMRHEMLTEHDIIQKMI